MRILATHQYYWPDTPPYASILRAIAERWVTDGHEVHVLSTQPGYKLGFRIEQQRRSELRQGVRVRRVGLTRAFRPHSAGRAFRRIAYLASIPLYALFRGPFDVIMVSTQPPVLAGLFARLAAKLTGACLIYHCMDIWPEVGVLGGILRPGFFTSTLGALDRANCRAARPIVVLSRDMEEAVRQRDPGHTLHVKIINNFSPPDYDPKRTTEPATDVTWPTSPERFRLIFAGNIGRFQGLDVLVDAIRLLSPEEEVDLLFVGEGVAVRNLRERAGDRLDRQIHFLPHQTPSVAKRLIGAANLCVVSLLDVTHRFAYPSKTMTYLELGQPLLVCANPDSELAEFVGSNGIGIVAPAGDASAICEAIRRIQRDGDRYRALSARAEAAGRIAFSQAEALDRWSELIRNAERRS